MTGKKIDAAKYIGIEINGKEWTLEGNGARPYEDGHIASWELSHDGCFVRIVVIYDADGESDTGTITYRDRNGNELTEEYCSLDPYDHDDISAKLKKLEEE